MNTYAKLLDHLRSGPVGLTFLRDALEDLLEALARDLGRTVDPATPEAEVARAAAEIDRLARAGTSCLVVAAEPPAQAMESLVALGWSWVPMRSEMVRDGAMPIRVAWTSSAIRGPSCGALWLVGATQAMAAEARRGLRRPPGVTITTGMVDRSVPAGVEPVIRDTDTTDPPSDPEPVLPPGCSMRPATSPPSWWVVHGLGHMVGSGSSPDAAAHDAWALFGRFMSREDYEALVAADLRELATARRLDDARFALDAAGVGDGDIAARIGVLASDATHFQATAARLRKDVADAQERERLAWAERDRASELANEAERRVAAMEAERDARARDRLGLEQQAQRGREAERELADAREGWLRAERRAERVADLERRLEAEHDATHAAELRAEAAEDRVLELTAARGHAREEADRLRLLAKSRAAEILALLDQVRAAEGEADRAKADELVARQRHAALGDLYNAERARLIAERDAYARDWAEAVGECDAARAMTERTNELLATIELRERDGLARLTAERDEALGKLTAVTQERDKAWATAKRAAAMLPPIKIFRSPEPGVRERVVFPDGSVCVERETMDDHRRQGQPWVVLWEVSPPYPAESMAADWSHERRRGWDQALAALTQSRDRAGVMLLGPEDPDHD